MNEKYIYTPSGTYAAKGRRLLYRYGITADIRPAPYGGCNRGVALVVNERDYGNAVALLTEYKVNFRKN